MNRYSAIGRLARDPEARYFESGTMIAQFPLAVDGRKKDEVHFFECKAWGKTAEAIASHLQKGRQIGIDGRLEQEKWTDRESGKQRRKVVVVVESFTFCGSKADTESDPVSASSGAAPQSSENYDDMPF